MKCREVAEMSNKAKESSIGSKVTKTLIYIFLSFLAVVYLLPLVWVLYVSVKDDKTLFVSPWEMPERLMIENYTFAWTAGKLGTATLNSAIVCFVTLILCLIIGSMAAFAIGRMRWKLASPMMTYFLTGMMIPVHCILIPLFVRFAKGTKSTPPSPCLVKYPVCISAALSVPTTK
mgnify:CR=1 FL=1